MPWIVGLYIASVAYSVVRYVVFAPKNLDNLPAFVTNKGVAMAAAICFVGAFVQQLRQGRGTTIKVDASAWFRAGVFGAIWHIPMALALLRPEYFKEFFTSAGASGAGRLSFAGEIVFCFGGLAAGTLYLVTRPAWSAMRRWQLSMSAMALLLVHVLAMGYCRGLNINSSHAYLPPMWLLSAIAIGAGLLVLAWSRPRG